LVFPWRDFNLQSLRGALLLGIICLLAAMLNPSGVKTFLYPLKYAFDDTSPFRQLGEWLSPFEPIGIHSPLFLVFMWAPGIAIAYFLPAVRKAVGVPWEGIVLTALTLAMAITSRRFIPLFGMSLAIILAPLLGFCLDRIRAQKYALVLALAALLFSVYRMAPYPLRSGPAFHYLVAEFSYPVDMMNFIEANHIHGKVYALYNWGGYLHWRTDGDLKVFMDGRADTIYNAHTYRAYVKVLTSSPGWIGLLEASEPDYILWPHIQKYGQQKMQQLLATGRWKPVYRDSVSWLLARNTIQLPDKLQSAPDTPWRDVSIALVSAWTGDTGKAIEYSEKARQRIPWHKNACNVLIQVYRGTGRARRADDVLRDCRSYFPSKTLR
jgi:hypothetical protein